MRHVKFPSIESLRHIAKDVSRKRKPIGFTDENQPIFNPLPKVTFYGSVKLHGTNAGVQYDRQTGEIRAAGRNRLLSIESDNYGFAFYVESQKEAFRDLFTEIILDEHNEDVLNQFGLDSIITIHGEWAGKGVQSRVAISEIEKRFYIFAISVTDSKKSIDDEGNDVTKRLWISPDGYRNQDAKIYNTFDYERFMIEIDFENPKEAADKINELTLRVEEECPVAKALGVSGIGEGIVWVSDSGLSFKSKGEKHSGKIKKDPKTNTEIEPAKLNSIRRFAEMTVTEGRLQQGISELFQDNGFTIKDTGRYLDWVMNDVLKEEMDLLTENNLDLIDVKKEVMTEARKWFMRQLDF